jgi:hypothetical protein
VPGFNPQVILKFERVFAPGSVSAVGQKKALRSRLLLGRTAELLRADSGFVRQCTFGVAEHGLSLYCASFDDIFLDDLFVLHGKHGSLSASVMLTIQCVYAADRMKESER